MLASGRKSLVFKDPEPHEHRHNFDEDEERAISAGSSLKTDGEAMGIDESSQR